MSPKTAHVDAETLDDLDDLDGAGGAGNGSGSGGGGRGAGGGGGSSRRPGAFRRLYRGETAFDFVGRRRIWFVVSSLIIVIGLATIGFRGLNLGIDFKGGTSWEVPAHGVSQSQAVSAVEAVGVGQPTVEILGGKTLEVQADLNNLPSARQKAVTDDVTDALARLTHTSPSNVSINTVGPTWGGEITKRAIIALVAFLVMVAIYISIRFEPKMALAAFIAMVHDLLVAIGVYAIFGFQVTPDTVIALLTILGYSLYDTVVVFDRVRDNTRGIGSSGRMTYSEMVNLSMNQTLARSINTSLVAIIPVLAVLLVGAELLGAITLQDYGLALFVGLLSGAYSSIFIASPMLAVLKEREPRYIAVRQRIESRRDRTGLLTPAAAALLTASAAGPARSAGRAGSARSGAIRPGAARASVGSSAARAATRAAPAPSAGTPGTAGTAPATGGARSTAAGGRTATGRPPPRPRKSTGKGKSKKRR